MSAPSTVTGFMGSTGDTEYTKKSTSGNSHGYQSYDYVRKGLKESLDVEATCRLTYHPQEMDLSKRYTCHPSHLNDIPIVGRGMTFVEHISAAIDAEGSGTTIKVPESIYGPDHFLSRFDKRFRCASTEDSPAIEQFGDFSTIDIGKFTADHNNNNNDGTSIMGSIPLTFHAARELVETPEIREEREAREQIEAEAAANAPITTILRFPVHSTGKEEERAVQIFKNTEPSTVVLTIPDSRVTFYKSDPNADNVSWNIEPSPLGHNWFRDVSEKDLGKTDKKDCITFTGPDNCMTKHFTNAKPADSGHILSDGLRDLLACTEISIPNDDPGWLQEQLEECLKDPSAASKRPGFTATYRFTRMGNPLNSPDAWKNHPPSQPKGSTTRSLESPSVS
ncbi:uncharacterized protein IL334_001757 [Kwoniella shivajii]|uniref:Uncharacterized protein n=1 Tax=Kwoniella shivajii TaxID=564305 RepID=A0ABZ1CVW3_9TREE|nr:hypothetical protein IL334_001757 [Kwoniella shivajii]